MRYRRPVVLECIALALLSGCGGSGDVSSSVGTRPTVSTTPTPAPGSAAAPGFDSPASVPGAHDLVIATVSTDQVVATVGSAQTVSITFASTDGLPMTGFSVSNSSASLPAGWSGPAGFHCDIVSTGAGCVLDLQYAPSAVDSGTLTLSYVVVDNSGLARTTGTVSIPYAATPYDNVLTLLSPTGEVDAAAGAGTVAVAIDFITDDGHAATNLTVSTNLAALPAGWTSAAPSLTCPIVSSGSGCQLMLTYAGSASGNGVLTLTYAYTDDSAESKTGSIDIPYRTTNANDIIATASPAGEILAVQSAGKQSVPVTFTTDDGRPATQLQVTSDLAHLPAGWTSAVQRFSCGSVSTGTGCQLPLTYAPTTLTGGTLALTYAYTDGAGAARTGLTNVSYAATTNDNLVGTAAPAGEIDAVVGAATPTVSVTFSTDDGRPATALQLTGNLAALPAGWSTPSPTFTCSGIDADTVCTLPLTFAPTAAESGTLALGYSYANNAGEAKTGTVNVPYRATTDDTMVATPSSTAVNIVTGQTSSVTVTFATDDGNPASGLTVSGLGALPSGWSSASSEFDCASVSAGTACGLTLTYAPAAVDAGTVTLPFSYTNDAGISRSGSTSITYTAVAPPP